MPPQTWDELWKGKEALLYWSQPDESVVALVPELKRRRVSRALDVGFGLGRHVVLLAKEGFDVHGIEPSQTGVEHCRAWLDSEDVNATVCIGDMFAVPYCDEVFDYLISWYVIYHGTLAQMTAALAELRRVTHAGGILHLVLNSTRNRSISVSRSRKGPPRASSRSISRLRSKPK